MSSRGSTWVSFGWFGAIVYGALWLTAAVLIGAVYLAWWVLRGVVYGVAWLVDKASDRHAQRRPREPKLPRLV